MEAKKKIVHNINALAIAVPAADLVICETKIFAKWLDQISSTSVLSGEHIAMAIFQ